jgi:hypothetical protein
VLTVWATADPAHHFFRIFGGVFAGIGGIFVLIAIGMTVVGRGMRNRGIATTATIVGYRSVRRTFSVGGGFRAGDAPADMTMPDTGPITGTSTGGGAMGPGFQSLQSPIVEFQTSGGQTIRTMALNGSNPRRGKVGEQITVHYNERNPNRVWADTGGRLMTGCVQVVMLGLGILFLAVGLEILAH